MPRAARRVPSEATRWIWEGGLGGLAPPPRKFQILHLNGAILGHPEAICAYILGLEKILFLWVKISIFIHFDGQDIEKNI